MITKVGVKVKEGARLEWEGQPVTYLIVEIEGDLPALLVSTDPKAEFLEDFEVAEVPAQRTFCGLNESLDDFGRLLENPVRLLKELR